jgi:DNA-binding MarR family transcriptional regulator
MSREKRTDPPRQPLDYLLKQAQHALRTRMDNTLRPLGLTAPQYAVLSAIERDPGISNAALARAAFVTPRTMQGIVVNLEREGLLKRTAYPAHGRISRGELTKRGRDVVARAHKIVDELDTLMTTSLTQEDKSRLANLLSRCTASLVAKEIEYKP